MKKILATISLAAIATLVQAQGYIEYYGGAANITTNSAFATIFGGTGTGGTAGKIGNSTSGQLYYFELLYATGVINGNSAPTNAAWSPVLAFGGGALPFGTNAPGPGNLWGPGNSGGIQVNLAAGTTYNVELVGWSAGLGSTLSQAWALASELDGPDNTFFGWTSVGTITPFATQGAGDPTLFPTTWANGSLVLYNATFIPEPGTLALAALGGASLLLFRRKK